MPATARLVVQMTPEEKRRLDTRARMAGVSTAEFVRRRVNTDDFGESREEIEAVLAALEATAPDILASVDRAVARANELSRRIDDIQGRGSL